MPYMDKDLPISMQETDIITLEDGTEIRYEENGGARDVFTNDDWTPKASLFPGMSYKLHSTKGSYILSAQDVGLKVEKEN